ncbi:hypothetical protein D3C73_813940 [compost metagenome]
MNGVLVGAGFDMHTVLQENVGGAQNVLALIGCIRHVMEPSHTAPMFFGAGKIIRLVVDSEPGTTDPAVVELDEFRDPGTEAGLHKAFEFSNVGR